MKSVFFFFFTLLNLGLYAQRVELHVLGTAQDAGAPQIACTKKCCAQWWAEGHSENVVSLGIQDKEANTYFVFEATPNLSEQHYMISSSMPQDATFGGVFLTHAHMGHYSGLVYLGKEALGGRNIPVYCMPRFSSYLKNNGPWEQLVNTGNISIHTLNAQETVSLSKQLAVIPIVVPHRDEYSETVGYIIRGPNKTALFLPDIDKWNRWKTAIESIIKQVDYAFLDATFYDNSELPHRDMSSIPHPFVVESLVRFQSLSVEDKRKIYFIHFNHTNPLLNANSEATARVKEKGFNLARTGMKIDL